MAAKNEDVKGLRPGWVGELPRSFLYSPYVLERVF